MDESKPVIRVRIAHSNTMKEGWRLSETTVEMTGTDISYGQLEVELRLAYQYGLDEAIRRNKNEHPRGVI